MTLYLVGGAPSAGLDDVYDAFVKAARTRGKRVVLCLEGTPEQAQEWVGVYADPIRARWPEVEIEPVGLVDTWTPPTPPVESTTPEANAEAVAPEASAEPEPSTEPTPEHHTVWPDLTGIAGLVVGGGLTPTYLASMTPQRDLIARLVRQDLPYLGFSAGAMITARHALIGGWKLDGRQVAQQVCSEGLEEVTVVDGLALISPTVQTHTDAWSNEGVVISLVEGRRVPSAVAIDEATCLAVDPITGRTQRLGQGRVRWFNHDRDGVIVRTDAPKRA